MGNLINLGNIFSGTDSKTVNDEFKWKDDFKMTIDRDDLFTIKKSIQYESDLLRNNHGMNLTICMILNNYLKRKSYLLTDRDECFYVNKIWENLDRNIEFVERVNSAMLEESDWTKREDFEGTWFNLLQHCQKTKRKWHKPAKYDDKGRTYFEVAVSSMKRREKFNERLALKLKLIQEEEKNENE